tara:strand:- start:193 stop:780 length:588 start_codon:yes stop_codon:yes gene_type:complete
MNLKELRERLKKEPNPEKFLRTLLEKTKDKRLKEIIKIILEKKKAFGESRLERAVRKERVSVKKEEPRLTIQLPDVEEERIETKTDQNLVPTQGGNVDYTLSKSGGVDYATGSTHQQLEQSSMIARDGHLDNAQTQGAIDKKMGEYNMSKDKDKYSSDDNSYESSSRESFTERTAFDSALGVDRDKKKKRLGDYL